MKMLQIYLLSLKNLFHMLTQLTEKNLHHTETKYYAKTIQNIYTLQYMFYGEHNIQKNQSLF